ncbi:YycH family regulatory protein [Bacillus thermotolerans]|uniref:YycH protein n=1 Tax=Bacillus thermotolerans TaxID=1221996 RepID=A0A0F5I1E2_BACTR|nr:two-component system activity regulator YycH [Bacillus thermotolerans]KKB37441.1 YycH protein [Bacillus thermotolerans]KKB39494.1 YycH protein [Bacillus thermotolerans]KKB44130.1 YycH protein [Bacillus thermotolerans]
MNYEKIKSIVLGVLVLLSIIFTLGIWNYQPNYDPITEDNIHEVASISEMREEADVIKPSTILYHTENEHYGTAGRNEMNAIIKELQEWSFVDIVNVSPSISERGFKELLYGKDRVELKFPTFIPFYTIDNVLNFEDGDTPNAVFDRIIISEVNRQARQAVVYFVSTKERLVFRSSASAESMPAFKKQFMDKAEEQWETYQHIKLEGASDPLFLPEESPRLKREKYLPDELNVEDFKDLLFEDPSLVKKGTSGEGEEYTDGSSLMEVNYDTNTISYVNPAIESETTTPGSLHELVDKSIQFVNEHSGWSDQYRLFEAEPGSASISYRLYKNGVPVFNKGNMAEIMQIWGKSDIYMYVRPYFTLDISLPSEAEEITLPNSTSALEQIQSMEDFDAALLEDLIVGYELQQDPQSSKVLVLEPAWFYKYNGRWDKLSFTTQTGGNAYGLE